MRSEVQDRSDLASLFRAMALHDMHEGIDNHCSLALAVRPGSFLMNPFGPHWSEVRASDLLVVGPDGKVEAGREGDESETTAFALHHHLHNTHPDAGCVIHTHMPYTSALAATQQGFDPRLSQNAAKFHGAWAFYTEYAGRLADADVCRAISNSVADGVRIVLLANHGVLIVAETVAHAWWDLYFFERAAMVQVLAGSSGQAMRRMSERQAAETAGQFVEERAGAALFWAAVRRQVERELPGVAG